MTRYAHIVLIILFLLLVIHIPTFPQYDEIKFEHLTVEDGLPENTVNCILQDHMGFLWLGTQNGLVKYDGYSMKVYRPVQGDTSSISGGNIRKIFEDRKGNIWAGTYSRGLNSFDYQTEIFTRYMHISDDTTSINSNHINCIYEDKIGRLWVGTDKGLNLMNSKSNSFLRYYLNDGAYSGKVYDLISSLRKTGKTIGMVYKGEHKAQISKEFNLTEETQAIIVITCEGINDYGWIENEKGNVIAKYNPDKSCALDLESQSRMQITLDTLNAGVYRAYYISGDSQAYSYWFGKTESTLQPYGIQIFNTKDEIIDIKKLLTDVISIPASAEILSISEDPLTWNLLIGSYVGKLWTFDVHNQTFTKYFLNTDINFVDNLGYIREFQFGKDGNVWMCSNRGLIRLDAATKQVEFYQVIPSLEYIQDNDFHSILEDRNGLIWGTIIYAGLVTFNKQTEKFHRYLHDANDPNSISINRVLSLYEDHSGILWIGTWGGGLEKWDKNKNRFKSYTHNPKNKNSLNNNNVRSIYVSNDNEIWLGTEGGLDKLNNVDRVFKHYRFGSGNLSDNTITAVLQDNSGILWLGTLENGLLRYDLASGSYRFYKNVIGDLSSISANYVRCILEDSNQILWVGTWGSGLNRFDKESGKFKRFQHIPGDINSISDGQVNVLYEDISGILWVGTNIGGLNRFDSKTETFSTYKSLDVDKDFSTITAIYEDKYSNFWIGTDQNGIFLFDRNKDISISNFDEEDGLANNDVKAILEDDSGNLWISTINGLSKFNPRTTTFKNYTASDGLCGNNFSRASAFVSNDGKMFFGTGNGLVVFHPDRIKDDPIPPKVVISDISLFNRPGEKLDFSGIVSLLKMIRLSYDQNDLRIDYVGLHFSKPEKNRYKYLLEGFDENWIEAGTQRNATYTNLDPGEYIFRVTACNKDGIWNEKGASIRIIIAPPLWATMWAYLLYVLIIISIIYFTWKLQLRRIKVKQQLILEHKQAEKFAELDQIKSRFFTNISHEFRTPLTLIKGPAKQILEETDEQKIRDNAELIHRSADKLNSLVKELMDLSKLEAGEVKLKASLLNIIPIITNLVRSFTPLAERKNITLKFNSMEEQLKVYLDLDKVEKMITNVLSNAFKFTPEGGKITIAINKLATLVEINISDTGIGIPENRIDKIFDRFYQVDGSHTRENEGAGIGLALTKELVEIHKGEISVESKEGEGSTFTIRLPLGKEHLKPDEICEAEEIIQEMKDIKILEELILKDEETNIDLFIDGEKPLVIIVEDNIDVRNFMRGFLAKDYTVIEAVDGEEGFKKSTKHIPDLIISDIMMPRMDGFQLCEKLKTDERTSHIPIILLTAKATNQDKIAGYETGADDYIMKPFDVKILTVRVKNLITQRKKLREHFKKEGLFDLENKNLTPVDKSFLQKVNDIISKNLSDASFGVEAFASEISLNRVTLHKKLIAMVGESPGELIKRIRLTRAAKLIENNTGNISEIALEVGFNNPGHFSESFKKQFGVTPSQFKRNFTNS